MSWLGPELEHLTAVVAGTLDDQGVLLAANVGFLRLVSENGREALGVSVASFFVQPTFDVLRHAPSGADGEVFRGLLTVGEYRGRTRSLLGSLRRVGGELRLLAEHDVVDLERLCDTVLALNRDYAETQLQLAYANHKLQQREAQIVELSLTDALTGVGNRRKLEQALVVEVARAARTGAALSALMVDLDHFKRINDHHGHDVGDRVLAAFGGMLRAQTRATDIVTRFGGEEFVVLLPNSTLAQAVSWAERVRLAIADFVVLPEPIPLTASFGAGELRPGESAEALVHRIDEALYEAKQSGRNRVVAG